MGRDHFASLERYHEYDKAINELMASILMGVAESSVLGNEKLLKQAMCDISKLYPFVDLLYTLDVSGIQNSANIVCEKRPLKSQESGIGRDRRQRPYYVLVKDTGGAVVTEPYLSSATGKLCISAIQQLSNSEGKPAGYMVLDISLADTIGFLMGDSIRKKFVPFFSSVYSIISIGLFLVVGTLLMFAGQELYLFVTGDVIDGKAHLKPFSVIIYLTLGLAIFDLAKTILEEEVLMHKDIFRHSSTRRTITRFVAAILIAVLIEALLLMFKAAVGGGDSQQVMAAVFMMLAAVALLIGLGIYVYLGAKAEHILIMRKEKS